MECEAGQEPDDMVATIRDIAGRLGNPSISIDSQARLVVAHQAAERVPEYIRAAIKALRKTVGQQMAARGVPLADDGPVRIK
jgi:hypothetical protein